MRRASCVVVVADKLLQRYRRCSTSLYWSSEILSSKYKHNMLIIVILSIKILFEIIIIYNSYGKLSF